ncbi:membrane protein [Serratia marcescens]|nr:membrane protein [Serratia marcescens]
MFEWIMDPNAWLALGTLTILEIVLGIDNIIFLSLVVAKLPKAQQNKARRLGLAAAMIMRLALLASIAWVIRLTHPLFTVLDHAVSARDLILLLGGLSDHLFIMMAAVVIAVGVMMFAARPIGDFVNRHPSVKMLALAFLILVGFTLMLESFQVHVPKGYIYFAMFFSMSVEALNLMRSKKNRSPE